MREGSLSYRLLCLTVPVANDLNSPDIRYNRQLAANLHELRLAFLWPQLPNGNVGPGRQSFRTMIAGQLVTNIVGGNYLYFFQPQSFTNIAAVP
ncbi:MAG: hypothetical protein WDM76_19245 [Limisphaerales bacterium]